MPILKPDEAMMEAAVNLGSRIALLATFEPTLGTASAELKSMAEKLSKAVDVRTVHVDGALKALQSGDPETHEKLIVRRRGLSRTSMSSRSRSLRWRRLRHRWRLK